MTMTVLDRALMAGDAGRVTGEQERPDPEVTQLSDLGRSCSPVFPTGGGG
jgi:hypothetical protein